MAHELSKAVSLAMHGPLRGSLRAASEHFDASDVPEFSASDPCSGPDSMFDQVTHYALRPEAARCSLACIEAPLLTAETLNMLRALRLAIMVSQTYEFSAPKFMDLSTIVVGDDGLGGDDPWFERTHPLHESRRPKKPLRSLLAECVDDPPPLKRKHSSPPLLATSCFD
eukprot:COSAG06_NODE_1931_length_8044_cov_5.197609_3_plen_169_part_00